MTPEPVGVGRIEEIVVDCLDPASLATFWSAVLGTVAIVRDPDWATVPDPTTGLIVAFQRVPEPKQVKNRLHLDIAVTEIGPATAQSMALGASTLGPVVHDEHGAFQVMLDPEGHEFCLVNAT